MTTSEKTSDLIFNKIKSMYLNYYNNNFKYVLDQKILFNTQNKKYNIVVGVKGREKYLHTTIKYLKNSINYSSNPSNYNIIVCEHDYTPKHNLYCLKNNIDYGFIDLKKSKTNNLYSRSLVFNYAVKCFPSSEWYLLHDCDLLTPNLFFKNLEKLTESCKTWIQPYSNKMVLNLSIDDTTALQNSAHEIIKDLDAEYYLKVKKNTPGAVGGSILVPHNLFYEVGGFDNEIFYGYAPEDALFWFKLECLFQKIEFYNHWYNHFGAAMYSSDNNLYHQWHSIEVNKNPEHGMMVELRNNYVGLDYKKIKELISLKKDLFLNA
jgi:hypothetical protein